MKLFSEIYSTYYSITEKILKRHTVTKAEIADIIRQNGFSESVLFLEPKLTCEDGYGLLKKEDNIYRSILKKEPHIPLTALEKAWLCAVLSDPRSGLFLDTEQKSQLTELLDAKKLYQRNFLTCFDQYSDGDDFHDPQYIQHFRDILSAIHGKKLIKISFQTRKDNRITHYFLPTKIEYSAKNNKFRVYVNRYQKRRIVDSGIINLSQVTLTKLTDITPDSFLAVTDKKKQAMFQSFQSVTAQQASMTSLTRATFRRQSSTILHFLAGVQRIIRKSLPLQSLKKSRSLMRTAVNVWYLLNMMSRMKMR